MTLRCKQGDLAVLIQDEPECQQNIGKVVRVRGPILANERGQLTWLIEPVKDELWATISPKSVPYQRHITWMSQVEHPDEWLMPLRPEPANDLADRAVTVPVTDDVEVCK